MNTRSKFSSLRSDMSRSFGSNACASTARSCNAPSTALPDRSDISLSAERPPMSTATFPNRLPLISSPSRFTHDPHFTFQCHICFSLYCFLHEIDHLFDVTRRRLALVDNEIGMHHRYRCAAYAPAFEAACLNQAGGMVPRRIA